MSDYVIVDKKIKKHFCKKSSENMLSKIDIQTNIFTNF